MDFLRPSPDAKAFAGAIQGTGSWKGRRGAAALCAILLALVWGCAPPAKEGEAGTPPMDKIAFDLNLLNEAGLYGPPDGLRAMSYEFCIPAVDSCEQRVRSIDPSIVVHRGGRGRIGCSEDQFLCVGSTSQPDFRRVIVDLAKLSYVDRIEPAYFE